MKIITLLLIALSVFSKDSSELKRLTKCYSVMARDAITVTHPLYVKVKNNELSGVDACMKLFDLAKLNQGGEIARAEQVNPLFTRFQSIITNKCLSCHSGTEANFSNFNSEKDWLNSKYITAGSSKGSKLFRVLKGSGVMISEESMPKNRTPLSSAEISDIRSWIESASLATVDMGDDGRSVTAKNILKTFNDFHRSWFANHDLNGSLDGCSPATTDLIDNGEMAYYVTRAMFTNLEFKDFVTSDETLMGIRASNYDQSNRLLLRPSTKRKVIIGVSKGASFTDEDKYEEYAPPVVERGILVGIKSRPPHYLNGLHNVSNLFSDPSRVDIFNHLKVGAIGSSPYVIMNAGISRNQLADGALKVRRRWSRSVLNDVLCRDVPVIRTSDAMKYLDKSGESPLSFRNGISCMQCHATMDPMARGLRNVRHINSTNSCDNAYGHPFTYLHQVEASLPEHPNEWKDWIDNSDRDFYKRPSVGKFLFRTADGKLIDNNFENIDELGNILSETDDLYYCAVKRYLYFFTGVNVPLFDPGDINRPATTEGDSLLIEYIKSVAKDFKSSQSQELLIKKIIASDLFLNN